MEKHITDYKELYATFMRLKDNKPQQECIVKNGRKEKHDGSNASR